MNRPLSSLVLLLAATLVQHLPCSAQATCADASSSKLLPALTAVDTAEHTVSGLHSFSISAVAKCTYSRGKTSICDVTCNVDPANSTTLNPLGNFTIVETGVVIVGGTHDVSGGWVSGVAQGFGSGATCTGQMAAGAANCGALATKCILGISVTPSGASLTTASGATVIWRSPNASIPVSCAAVPDPQGAPTPTPTPPPAIDNSGDCPPSDGFISPVCFTDCGGCPSPIIVDLTGDGFFLTSAADGVFFDIKGNGTPMRIGWTAAGAENAFLALPGSDGLVHNGKQLFGNFTPQPASEHPNGFLALAEYDKPENGGNGDGLIDSRDAVFASLRLWLDANHDGICQPEELYTLSAMGVDSLSLDYSLLHRTDRYGNVFRYRARLNQELRGRSDIGKKAYDVFFVHN